MDEEFRGEDLPAAKLTDRFLAYLVDTVPFCVGYFLSLPELASRGLLENTAAGRRQLFFGWVAAYVVYHALSNVG